MLGMLVLVDSSVAGVSDRAWIVRLALRSPGTAESEDFLSRM